MKAKVHMRVARGSSGKPLITATSRRSDYPLFDSNNNPLPTVAFSMMLDIPDQAFDRADQVIAEVRIPEDQLEIVAQVTEVAAD